MTDPDTGAPPADPPADPPPAPPDTGSDGGQVDWKAEAEKFKALARKHEDRAKGNASAAAELAKFREAQMSEQEKAVAAARREADETARADERGKAAGRLVAAEFRAQLAGRVDPKSLPDLLAGINPASFVADDGEVDTKAVEKFAAALAPARPASFDGGPRGTAMNGPTDMNALIRRHAGIN
jgi:hypothetical protein